MKGSRGTRFVGQGYRRQPDRVVRVIGQRAARRMVEGGRGGVILYTASISSLGGSPEFSHYNASKAGIANLVKTMALELVDHGIRVNCISPGPSDTQQSVDLVGEDQMDRWRREGFPVVPMGRLEARMTWQQPSRFSRRTTRGTSPA